MSIGVNYHLGEKSEVSVQGFLTNILIPILEIHFSFLSQQNIMTANFPHGHLNQFINSIQFYLFCFIFMYMYQTVLVWLLFFVFSLSLIV